MVDIGMSIMTDYAQNCAVDVSQTNIIEAKDDCTIEITDSQLRNSVIVNKECLQSISTISAMSTSTKEQFDQMAKAVTQSFGMPSVTVSENILRSSYDLSQEIVTTYVDDCATEVFQNNSVTCEGNGSVVLNGVELSNLADIEESCAQKVLNDSSQASELEQAISQTAVAQQESKFSGIITAFFAVVAAVVIVLIVVKTSLSGSTGSGNRGLIGLLVGAVVVLGLIVGLYILLGKKKGKNRYPKPEVNPKTQNEGIST